MMILSVFFVFSINAVILGYSIIFKKILFKNSSNIYQEFDFLLGYLFLISISLFFNFFAPLNILSLPIIILGFLSFIYFFLKKMIPVNILGFLLIINFFLIFITIDNQLVYDTKLYHLQTVKYYTNYKVIFGISNIEPRLAMNSTWHLLISLFNFNFININILYLLNYSIYSFFLMLLFFKKKNPDREYYFLFIFIIYLFIYSYFHPNNNGTIFNSLGSPEVDTISMILFCVCCYIFLKEDKFKSQYEFYVYLLTAIILSITTKLSSLALVFFIAYFIFKKKNNYLLYKINIFFLIFFLLWLLKSIFNSGCLVFPLSYTCFDFSWSMGHQNVETYNNIIKSFNRSIGNMEDWSNFEITINSFKWFIPWIKNYFIKVEFLYISFLIIFILGFLNIIVNLQSILNIKDKKNSKFFLTYFVLTLSFIIWLQAPELRFSYGFVISFISLLLLSILKKINIFRFIEKFDYPIIFIAIFLMLSSNYKNFNKSNNNLFNHNFDYSNFKKYIDSNEFKVFYPDPEPFCNMFKDFCSWQKFNVNIQTKKGYIIVENKWN